MLMPLSSLLGSFLLTVASPQEDAVDARQIHWQRSLEDALLVARATGRPLFVAVNMDGESASDRIVHENYRDPAFVAATRELVCVVGSVFRHSLRDHDEHGRRVPCPRLGEVTCGEHMALEPQLFEAYLSDGERVAPRHAVIQLDGTKDWDLALLFDLNDISKSLFESAAAQRERRGAARVPAFAGESLRDLARRRDHRGRLALERAIEEMRDASELVHALEALATDGDRGATDALRVVAARLPAMPETVHQRFVATARALGLEREAAVLIQQRLREAGTLLGTADDGRFVLLPVLGQLGPLENAARSTLLAHRALHSSMARADRGLEHALGTAERQRIATRVNELGPLHVRLVIAIADHVARTHSDLPRTVQARELRDARAIEASLAELEAQLEGNRDAPNVAAYAMALLDLGRVRLAVQDQNAYVLFGDAERTFAQALELDPMQPAWWNERARAAYQLGDHAQQVRHAEKALELTLGALPGVEDPAGLDDELAVEALRWIGDGHARLLGARMGGDPVEEIDGMLRGMRALAVVAASPWGGPSDWAGLASFLGALGLRRHELALAECGARRLPDAGEPRQVLRTALWNTGDIGLAATIAERLLDATQPIGDAPSPAHDAAQWYAGYEHVFAAEDARRRESMVEAIRAYGRAREHFEAVRARNADWGESCDYYVAVTHLGEAMALVRAGRRAEAAEALVRAVETGIDLASMRDGIGYDVYDLVDKIFEWRSSGPSPVDARALYERLAKLAPHTPFWATTLADTLLREAIRADGRNPERAWRKSVDAAGEEIEQWLGLPCAEGDALFEASIEIARHALPLSDAEADRKPLAQALTILAERRLELGRTDDVQPALAEAAPLMGLEAPARDATTAELQAKADELRTLLGEARPRFRPGR